MKIGDNEVEEEEEENVWDEEWRAGTFEKYGGYDCMSGSYILHTADGRVPFDTPKHEPDPVWEARARLASAAPEMARVLLAVEWAVTDDCGSHYCPSCDEPKFRDIWHKVAGAHSPGCALDAALRKAGVR